MQADEECVAEFLQSKGLEAEKFTKEARSSSKTPDFCVLKNGQLVFFCEVKSISREEWLGQLTKSVPAATIAGGGGNDAAFNRLSNKIHEAVQQFNAVNPDLKLPNVLAFVNHETRLCNYGDLIGVVTGNIVTEAGDHYPIYQKFSEGRIKKEKCRIHLYIWIDESQHEYYGFNPSVQEHFTSLRNHFVADPHCMPMI